MLGALTWTTKPLGDVLSELPNAVAERLRARGRSRHRQAVGKIDRGEVAAPSDPPRHTASTRRSAEAADCLGCLLDPFVLARPRSSVHDLSYTVNVGAIEQRAGVVSTLGCSIRGVDPTSRRGAWGPSVVQQPPVLVAEMDFGGAAETPGSYAAWNDAVAQVMFSEANRNRPVYLDMESATLGAMARLANVKNSPRESLCRAVGTTLGDVNKRRNIFGRHLDALRFWVWQGRGTVPPFLALLAVFALSAEDMRSDETLSGANYYGRLARNLAIDATDRRSFLKLQNDFRKSSLAFWEQLNSWLADLDGERGLPTAYALDWRSFVGVPISQALVRGTDRARLVDFFLALGFAPRASVALEDMVRLLDQWLPASSVSGSLQRLWRLGKEARERIAGVVIVELSAWDGAGLEIEGARAHSCKLRLVAELRSFPRLALELAVAFRGEGISPGELHAPANASEAATQLLEPCGGSVRSRAMGPDGWLVVDDEAGMCVGGALHGALTLCDEGQGLTLSRGVKRLIVLQHDESTQLFVEVDHVQLGCDCLLLAHEQLWSKEKNEIQRVLREGYVAHEPGTIEGLPSHWALVRGAQVVDLVEEQDHYLAGLSPLSSTQVSFSGGFALPGRSVWHAERGPEVTATCLGRADFVVCVRREQLAKQSDDEKEFGPFEQVGIIVPAELPNQPGDYVVEVRSSRAKTEALSRVAYRLRTSDSQRPVGKQEQAWVGHDLSEECAVATVSADALDAPPSGACIRGALLSVPAGAAERQESGRLPPEFPGVRSGSWGDPEDEPPAVPARNEAIADLAPGCPSGGHYFRGPDAITRKPSLREWEGVECVRCGLPLHFPKRADNVRHHLSAKATALPRQVPTLPPRKRDHASVELLLDVLAYLGRAEWPAFERLAKQVDDSPAYAWELARRLSCLSYVDLVLDSCLRVRTIAAAPPVAALVEGGNGLVCGCLPGRLLCAIRDLVGEKLRPSCDDLGVPLYYLEGADEDEMAAIGEMLVAVGGKVAERDTALRLLDQLEPLRDLAGWLDERPLPQTSSLRRFAFDSNRWESATSCSAPGAYAVRSFTAMYGVRMQSTPLGRFLVCDVVTSKYVAAAELGASMVWYDRQRHELICRLGAPLPGLIERAVVLASGRSPLKHADGTFRYQQVDECVARRVGRIVGSRASVE